jgi:hypothetical protein
MTQATSGWLGRLAAVLAALAFAVPAARAAEKPVCEPALLALWGDGRHDDTKALNAWFKGDRVVWGATGEPVGAAIAGRVFRLSSTVFVPSGTGRRLEGFEMIWPARRERVSGGAIDAGNDRDKPATTVGIVKIGAGPDEGVPYKAPPPRPADPGSRTGCLIS